MTSLAWLMFDGVGGSMGGWMSATVFHEYGGTVTFWIYGWISLVGAVIILYLQTLVSSGKEIKTTKQSVC